MGYHPHYVYLFCKSVIKLRRRRTGLMMMPLFHHRCEETTILRCLALAPCKVAEKALQRATGDASFASRYAVAVLPFGVIALIAALSLLSGFPGLRGVARFMAARKRSFVNSLLIFFGVLICDDAYAQHVFPYGIYNSPNKLAIIVQISVGTSIIGIGGGSAWKLMRGEYHGQVGLFFVSFNEGLAAFLANIHVRDASYPRICRLLAIILAGISIRGFSALFGLHIFERAAKIASMMHTNVIVPAFRHVILPLLQAFAKHILARIFILIASVYVRMIGVFIFCWRAARDTFDASKKVFLRVLVPLVQRISEAIFSFILDNICIPLLTYVVKPAVKVSNAIGRKAIHAASRAFAFVNVFVVLPIRRAIIRCLQCMREAAIQMLALISKRIIIPLLRIVR